MDRLDTGKCNWSGISQILGHRISAAISWGLEKGGKKMGMDNHRRQYDKKQAQCTRWPLKLNSNRHPPSIGKTGMMIDSGCMGTRGLRDIINGGMTNSTTPSSGRLEGQHRCGTLTRVPRDNWQPNSRM